MKKMVMISEDEYEELKSLCDVLTTTRFELEDAFSMNLFTGEMKTDEKAQEEFSKRTLQDFQNKFKYVGKYVVKARNVLDNMLLDIDADDTITDFELGK